MIVRKMHLPEVNHLHRGGFQRLHILSVFSYEATMLCVRRVHTVLSLLVGSGHWPCCQGRECRKAEVRREGGREQARAQESRGGLGRRT